MDSDKKTTKIDTDAALPEAAEEPAEAVEEKPNEPEEATEPATEPEKAIDEDEPEKESVSVEARDPDDKSEEEPDKEDEAAEEKEESESEEKPTSPSDLSDLTDDEPEKDEDVPSIDTDAPLQIEQIKKPSRDIPETNLKAPLKIEGTEESEENGEQEKSGKKLFVFGGITLAVIVLLTIGFFAFSAREAQKEEKAEKAATENATPAPVSTPKPTIDKSQWSLEVLNGSGVPGAAKKIADQITALGYQVVKTGNASKSDYAVTEVIVKKELLDKVDLLIADLKDVIKISSQSGDLKDSTASARIILGKE